MSKDAYYFSHDSNSRFDSKILRLRAKYGLEGYWFYFCLLEIMRDNSNYMICKNDIDTISFQLQIELSKAKAMLELCLNIGLFSEKDGYIYSLSFLERMEQMNELRKKRQEAGRKGGKAKAKLKQNDSIKGKEIKEKEIKEKLYGEYGNVFLSENNYKKLLGICLNQNLLSELIDSLSKNIEIGKENRYQENLPNAHFERLKSYYDYRKKNPDKFSQMEASNPIRYNPYA